MASTALTTALYGLLAAIAAPQPTPAPQLDVVVPQDTFITLERTSCYGECPVYQVSISADGTVTYEGHKFVRVTGRQTSSIPRAAVASLLAAAERIRFFDLRDSYETILTADGTVGVVTDLPTHTVTITSNGRTKRIIDYVGSPWALRQFENQIDEAAQTRRWIRLDGPTAGQLLREGLSPSSDEAARHFTKALQRDDVDVVTALLEAGLEPNRITPTRGAILRSARSAAAAKALLAADPSLKDTIAGTTLFNAASFYPDAALVLIDATTTVDTPSNTGGRPLWAASCNGHAAVVKALLAAGADPTISSSGSTPLECARQAPLRRQELRFFSDMPDRTDYEGVISLLEDALAKRKQ